MVPGPPNLPLRKRVAIGCQLAFLASYRDYESPSADHRLGEYYMNSPWVCIPILVFLLIQWEKIMMWLAGGLINIGILSVCLDLFRFNLSGSSGLE